MTGGGLEKSDADGTAEVGGGLEKSATGGFVDKIGEDGCETLAPGGGWFKRDGGG